MGISISSVGSFLKKSDEFLKKCKYYMEAANLEYYGEKGVQALRDNTPIDSGITAESWYYTINKNGSETTLSFNNSHIVDGVNIAIMIQYGHMSRNNTWIEGNDFVSPALDPIFDEMVRNIKEGILIL